MVLKTFEVIICHQPNAKYENEIDINAMRLSYKLEKEGFHIWKDTDPKRFEEGVNRSKVVIICLSRQSELSTKFNEKLNIIIKSGKPIVLATIEPDYELPKENAPAVVDRRHRASVQSIQSSIMEELMDSENVSSMSQMLPYLKYYHNFILCGKKISGRTNVCRLMECVKKFIRECDAHKPEECFCWICREIRDPEKNPEAVQYLQWEAMEQESTDAAGDELDGEEEDTQVHVDKHCFFVGAAASANSLVYLTDAKNHNIKVYDYWGTLLMTSTNDLYGIQHIAVLDSMFVLVSQKYRRISEWHSQILILNEDLSEVKPWETPEEIYNPNCLAVLRDGNIAITSDTERPNSYSRIYFVTEVSPEVFRSFPLNIRQVTSMAASQYSDVIAASSWRLRELRLFDYKGHQLWFLIWKDELLLRAPYGLGFLSSEELLLCEKDQNSVLYLNTKNGETIKRLEDDTLEIIRQPQQIAISPSSDINRYIVITDSSPDPKFIKL